MSELWMSQEAQLEGFQARYQMVELAAPLFDSIAFVVRYTNWTPTSRVPEGPQRDVFLIARDLAVHKSVCPGASMRIHSRARLHNLSSSGEARTFSNGMDL